MGDGRIFGPKVREFVLTKAFQRKYGDLPKYIKDDFETDLLGEMRAGRYAKSRDLKKRQGVKKNQPTQYQVRLSRSHRMTFEFKKETATLLLIGEHKEFD